MLPPERKAAVRGLCLHFLHRQQVFGEWGFDRKTGQGRPLAALFAGPPGTGKTMVGR